MIYFGVMKPCTQYVNLNAEMIQTHLLLVWISHHPINPAFFPKVLLKLWDVCNDPEKVVHTNIGKHQKGRKVLGRYKKERLWEEGRQWTHCSESYLEDD